MWYWPIRSFCALILHIFFRQLHVSGLDQLPKHRTILFVANHTNAFVDAFLFLTVASFRVTLTGKHTLRKNPLLRLLFGGLGVEYFHRAADRAAQMEANQRTFHALIAHLYGGGRVLLFPEGISHSDPQMREFKTGAARLAQQYVEQHNELLVVPIGFLYTQKNIFRSDVWIRAGAPIVIIKTSDDVRTVTAQFDKAVRELTVNLETEQQSQLLQWASRIVLEHGQRDRLVPGSASTKPQSLFALQQALITRYRAQNASDAAAMREIELKLQQYRQQVTALDIEPYELGGPYRASRVALFLLRELEVLTIGSFMAGWGILHHALPYLSVHWLTKRTATDLDHFATHKFLLAGIFYPFWYALQGMALGFFWGGEIAALYLGTLPFCGYYALLYLERLRDVIRRVRLFGRLLLHRQQHEDLVALGNQIRTQIAAMMTTGGTDDTSLHVSGG